MDMIYDLLFVLYLVFLLYEVCVLLDTPKILYVTLSIYHPLRMRILNAPGRKHLPPWPIPPTQDTKDIVGTTLIGVQIPLLQQPRQERNH